MMLSVIKILPIYMRVQLQTGLLSFCIDSPALRFRSRFLKRLWRMSPRKGWDNATARMANPMMTWRSDQVGLNYTDCLAI
jgi:hypothetical protein